MVDECISLKGNEDFIRIIDGRRIYYGGNQEWFNREKYKKVGCAPVTAVNLLVTLSISEKIESLYRYNDLSLINFKSYMNEIVEYVKPRDKIGIINPREFIKDVNNFAISRGITFKTNWTCFQVGYRELCNFIKKGLSSSTPVALLILRNNIVKEFEWHWMTITRYYENEENVYLDISTWGERRLIRLKDVYKYSSYGALVYFTIY